MSMVGQILSENPIGLAQLAKKIRSHRRVGHVSTQACWRWATKGVALPGGQVVKLEVLRLAGRYLTSWAAFERFVASQQSVESAAPLPAPARSPGRRDKSSRKAEQVLEKAGL